MADSRTVTCRSFAFIDDGKESGRLSICIEGGGHEYVCLTPMQAALALEDLGKFVRRHLQEMQKMP